MKRTTILTPCTLAALVLLAACSRNTAPASDGVIQTKFPGQVTSGGGTSGEVIARTARPVTDATYAGGTPGIAGGSGGNTSGAETGGTTRETGQGPTSGVTPPSGAMQGTQTQPGDMGKPSGPSAQDLNKGAASNEAPQGPAAPNQMEKK
ncbi:MAG: hypothetical protein AB1584_13580 [Pseudomonadota bacterium]